ncbi:glycoside hydrolase family 1 protein [Erwinia sp. 9145]|uniref:glycoside hydrolase family 1 protein n=1 Tax=Erwinia sp. 9145 TaxID=1500895 RepID=UPI000555DA41|nr:glycoside hydrolase family 1 protein [Erwinia sp. 9145]
MKTTFPENFWWGCAESAAQTEGEADTSASITNWQHWYQQQPERFFNQHGPQHTRNSYSCYKQDVKRMRDIGLNSFRTSISWARLLPDGKNADPKAIDYYRSFFNELKNSGIEPVVTLMHFDMPYLMQQKGGWTNRAVVNDFADYAARCFELFSNEVKHWITFNEPIVPLEGGYLYDFHYPNQRDFRMAAQAAFFTQLAHAKAVNAYRASGQKGKIGIVLNLTPSYPRSINQADKKAAHIADLLFNRSFLDPSLKGHYPFELITLLKKYRQLPEYTAEDLREIATATIDMLGVNYYHPRRVQAKIHAIHPQAPFMPEWFFDNYEMPGCRMNPYRGWEIYPQGLYDILTNLRDHYGNIPCFISENGMGVENEERFIRKGIVEDDYRIEFMQDHLRGISQAISEGSACFGYHCWTFTDNWSWLNAYKNRYGLYRFDLSDGSISPKRSAYWYQDVIKKNGF